MSYFQGNKMPARTELSKKQKNKQTFNVPPTSAFLAKLFCASFFFLKKKITSEALNPH